MSNFRTTKCGVAEGENVDSWSYMTIHMKRMPSSSQANPAKRRVDRGSTVKLMSESGAKNVARDFLAEQSLKSTMKMFTDS